MEKFGKIAVIVPVFNEERTIGLVINNIKKIATLIVVNDGSTDNTGLILKKKNQKKLLLSIIKIIWVMKMLLTWALKKLLN